MLVTESTLIQSRFALNAEKLPRERLDDRRGERRKWNFVRGAHMPKKNKHNDTRSAALRENGTMNPSPDQVADPKFNKSEFFDARDLVQVKYEMLRRVLVDAASVTEATMEYGVSRPTYYQTKASFDAGGLAGLV